jgi:site-specific DNA recombinase
VLPVRAAIYARVSSDQQAERHTIDSQVQELLARAAADGHEVAAEFRFLDDGHSGASLIRSALERLRDLAAMSAIDVVYVHAPDRLARSYAHQAVLIEGGFHYNSVWITRWGLGPMLFTLGGHRV